MSFTVDHLFRYKTNFGHEAKYIETYPEFIGYNHLYSIGNKLNLVDDYGHIKGSSFVWIIRLEESSQ